MATNSASMLRVGGLISGIDTESLIKSMMSAQQTRVDNLFRERTKLEYKRESLNNIYSIVDSFKMDFLSMQNTAKSMVSTLSFKQNTSTLAKNNYVSMTVTADAVRGSYTIDKVVSVASGAKLVSNEKATKNGTVDLSAKLSDLDLQNSEGQKILDSNGKLEFEINGQEFSFDGDATLREVMNKVNNTAAANVTFSYSSLSGTFTIASKNSGIPTDEAIRAAEVKFNDSLVALSDKLGTNYTSIDNTWKADADAKVATEYQQFTNVALGSIPGINPDDYNDADWYKNYKKLETAVNKIKTDDKEGTTWYDSFKELKEKVDALKNAEKAEAAITKAEADFVSANPNVVIENKAGNLFGSHSVINIDTDAINDAINGLLTGSDPQKYKAELDALGYSGPTNMEMVVNGEILTSNKNTVTVDGMTFTAIKATESGFTPLEFNVEQNVEEPLNRIKEFVAQYNQMVDKLYSAINETVYKDYYPLLESERSEMNETDIAQWTEKAKSGMLRRDSKISNLMASMRSAFSEIVGDTALNANSFGIKTANYYEGGREGKLTIDETKLREALANNPDMVYNAFNARSSVTITKSSTAAEIKQNRAESGIITRLTDTVTKYLDNVKNDVIKGMDEKLKDMAWDYTELLRKQQEKEQALWVKYSAMEQQLANLNNQSSWISSNMSG